MTHDDTPRVYTHPCLYICVFKSYGRTRRARCAVWYREKVFSRIGRCSVASNVFLESLTNRQSGLADLHNLTGGAGRPFQGVVATFRG